MVKLYILAKQVARGYDNRKYSHTTVVHSTPSVRTVLFAQFEPVTSTLHHRRSRGESIIHYGYIELII